MTTPPKATEHLIRVWEALAAWTPALTAGAPHLAQRVREARIVWLIGNGGSQALAEHWATDWHKVTQHRDGAVYIAPAANAGLVTMVANDYGFDQLFAHTLAAATIEDEVIAISTSGRSPNLLQQRVDWAICPERTPLATQAAETICGPPYPPAVLEDVFSIFGHSMAEELRA